MMARSAVLTTLGLTTAVQVLSSFLALGVPVLAPAIAADLAIDPDSIGYYPALMYSAALAICIIGDPLLSRARPMLRSLICVAVSTVGFALLLGASLPIFMVAAVLIGVGYGPVVPATSQILSARTPSRYANLIFSLKQSGAPLGGALAGLSLPLLVGLTGGWWSTVSIVSVSCAVLLLLLGSSVPWLDRDAVPIRSAGMLGPIKAVTALPPLRRLVIMSSSYGAMQLCLGAFLTVYLVHAVELDLASAGFIFGVSQAASIVGRLFWGYVADRFFSPRAVMAFLGFAMAATALGVASFTADWPMAAVLAVAFLYGATAMGWNGVLLAEVARLAPPGQIGRLTSGVMSANYAGVVVGPLLFTAIAAAADTQRAGFIAMGVITALCAAFSLVKSGQR
ncbi:MFS family permease [Rhodoligotrophos appendicifer]|uniref:MFS transporter n=1 Tax=Rhodoligotrophos appendicifer TaxID=987056 RepID=UPI0014781890|nr:MFS transporter [Rhodoligotrophos appendicifer]